VTPDRRDVVRILARQAARWHRASVQDNEPVVAALHADYAVGYALALRQVATDEEIKDVVGVTGKAMEDAATAAQDAAFKALKVRCPGILPAKTIELL
jgi:uncharacterized protein with PhoU and TrkA domain